MENKGKKEARKRQILDAAFRVLSANGYHGCSMLKVAKEAKASNETLYNWFGSKRGLFAEMVDEHSRLTAKSLAVTKPVSTDLRSALRRYGSIVCELATESRAIELNRAAAASAVDGGELGSQLTAKIWSLYSEGLFEIFSSSVARGEMTDEQAQLALETFLLHLIGGIQIRGITGADGPLSACDIRDKVSHALGILEKMNLLQARHQELCLPSDKSS